MEASQQRVLSVLGVWYILYTHITIAFRAMLCASRRRAAERRRRFLKLISDTRHNFLLLRQRRRRQVLALLNQRRQPTVWAFSRASAFWDVTMPNFTPSDWIAHFRMSEETFSYLCSKLRPAMQKRNTNFRACVPLRKRVAIALWKLATNSEYRSIGLLFGVSTTSVCRCVQDFCKAVCKILLAEVIAFPTLQKLQEMADYFETRWGIPQCVGAIDGSHIPIIAPQGFHTDYFNRKGWHSIILQGIVDGRGMFWNVYAGQPGSLHDARVLRLSAFWDLVAHGQLHPTSTKNIEGVNVGFYVLGDSAYPLQNWLLKPFSDNGRLTAEQQMYNRKTSRARVVVENAFGRLKGRWRCLLKRNDSDVELLKYMVLTCCVLHNICESHGEEYVECDAPADEPVVANMQEVAEEGSDVREALMRHFNR
uniref:Zgc:113227 n=1 Tax=Nothobranchius rachovii TaxID=451742 RepID=A0A1A8RNV6_9TELE